MTSKLSSEICAKCGKHAATAMCYGCEKAFCTRHFLEHRDELSQQLDSVSQDYEHFSRDLNKDSQRHSLLTRIDQWEKDSIQRIQSSAETARNHLRQQLTQISVNLNGALKKIKETLQSCRQSDDFTEVQISKWIDQLNEIRQQRDQSSNIQLDYDDDQRSAIRLVQIKGIRSNSSSIEENQQKSKIPSEEKFDQIPKNILVTNDGLKVTFNSAHPSDNSCVSGIGRYSSRVHSIRFRIEHIDHHSKVFFGVITASQEINSQVMFSPSTNGWCELDLPIINGKIRESNYKRIFRQHDELSLIFNCEKQLIQLEHHRTNRIVHIPIDLRYCPFPWKILVQLSSMNNSISIVH